MDLPDAPDAIAVAVSGTDVQFDWDAPFSGGTGVGISSYTITFKNSAGAFVTDVSNCDGSSSSVITNTLCSVPMSEFTGTLGLSYGDLIVAKVLATNARGDGTASAENTSGATVATVPQAPSTVPTEGSGTTTSQLVVEWAALTGDATGGSAITSYELVIDDGAGGAFSEVVGLSSDFTALTTTITSSISSGLTYKLKYRAKNIYGWGSYSGEASIVASNAPGTPGTPTTSLESDGSILIDWAAPASNGGESITSYTIEILTSDDSTYSTETTDCDGTSSTIVTNTECTIPMSTFWASPFTLAQGDNIQARIYASNTKGTSSASSVSSTMAQVEVVPLQPSSGPSRDSSSTNTALVVNMAALADPNDGGSTPTSYHLQWDFGDGSVDQDLVGYSTDSTALQYTTSASLTEGTTYLFRYRVKNIHGFGDYSASGILAATIPDAPAAPTTTIDNIYIKVEWLAPDGNGASVSAYEIVLLESDGSTYTAESTYCDGTDSSIVSNLYC